MSLTGNIKSGGTLRGKINGLKTIHGYSAYEVAVINGFRGTEEEWLLSLVGAQGEQGERGFAGIQVEYDAETETLYITGGEEEGTGVSVTHSWNGTVLTITSASGTSSADLKGATGAAGDSFVSLTYNAETGKWVQTINSDGNFFETEVDGIDVYSKSQIDTMFSSYIDDVAALVGGGAV